MSEDNDDLGYLYLNVMYDTDGAIPELSETWTKVGITIDPPARIKALSDTSSPIAVKTINLYKTTKKKDLEELIHEVLPLSRSHTGKETEWTRMPFDDIMAIIHRIQKLHPMEEQDVDKLSEVTSYKKHGKNSKQLVKQMKQLWQDHKDDFSKKYKEDKFDTNQLDYIGSGEIEVDGEVLPSTSLNIKVRPNHCFIDFNCANIFNKESVIEWANKNNWATKDVTTGVKINGPLKGGVFNIDDAYEVYASIKRGIHNKEFSYNE